MKKIMQAREGKFLHFGRKFWCILMLLCRLCKSGQIFIIIGFIVIIVAMVVMIFVIVVIIITGI